LGKLIVFEGVCGTGKTAIAKELVNHLNEQGYRSVYNHGAFTKDSTGHFLRQNALNSPDVFSSNFYLANLIQNTLVRVKPLLSQGYVVIQDRYVDSIRTYVNALSLTTSTHLPIESVIRLYQILDLLVVPSFTFITTAMDKTIVERLQEKDFSKVHNKFHEDRNFYHVLKAEFMKLTNKPNYYKLETDDVISSEILIGILGNILREVDKNGYHIDPMPAYE
jgi:thymidylate kinase